MSAQDRTEQTRTYTRDADSYVTFAKGQFAMDSREVYRVAIMRDGIRRIPNYYAATPKGQKLAWEEVTAFMNEKNEKEETPQQHEGPDDRRTPRAQPRSR